MKQFGTKKPLVVIRPRMLNWYIAFGFDTFVLVTEVWGAHGRISSIDWVNLAQVLCVIPVFFFVYLTPIRILLYADSIRLRRFFYDKTVMIEDIAYMKIEGGKTSYMTFYDIQAKPIGTMEITEFNHFDLRRKLRKALADAPFGRRLRWEKSEEA